MRTNSNAGSKKTVLIIVISVLAAAAVLAALIFTGVIKAPFFGGETELSESETPPSQTETDPAEISSDSETDPENGVDESTTDDGSETALPLFIPAEIAYEPGPDLGYEPVSYQLRWQEDRVSLYCTADDAPVPAAPYAVIYFDAETGELTGGDALGRYETHEIPDDIYFAYKADAADARALSSAKIRSEDELRKVCDRFVTFSGAGKLSEITVSGISSGFTFTVKSYEGETPLSGRLDGTTAGFDFIYTLEENGAEGGRFGKLTVGDVNGYYLYEYNDAEQLIAFHDDDGFAFTADGRLVDADETDEPAQRFADMTFTYNGDGLLTGVACANNSRYNAASVTYTAATPAQVRAYQAIASLGYNMVTGTQYCPLAPEDLYRGEYTGDVALSLLLPVNGEICVW